MDEFIEKNLIPTLDYIEAHTKVAAVTFAVVAVIGVVIGVIVF